MKVTKAQCCCSKGSAWGVAKRGVTCEVCPEPYEGRQGGGEGGKDGERGGVGILVYKCMYECVNACVHTCTYMQCIVCI